MNKIVDRCARRLDSAAAGRQEAARTPAHCMHSTAINDTGISVEEAKEEEEVPDASPCSSATLLLVEIDEMHTVSANLEASWMDAGSKRQWPNQWC
eukprot:182601-Pelagomonas_calceolata.AAC.2